MEEGIILLDFIDALDKLLAGKRITRQEWGDKRHYGLLQDHLLYIHKAGEKEDKVHPWLVSDADILSDDWTVI